VVCLQPANVFGTVLPDFVIHLLSDYDLFMNDLRTVTKGEFTFDIDGQAVATNESEETRTKAKRGGKAGRGGNRGARGRGGK